MNERVEHKDDLERPASPAVAQITLLYESRDGRLCLFEDAKGHLHAVPAASLA